VKVKVYAPAFASFQHLDDDSSMKLPEGATLNDVFRRLKIPLPLRPFLVYTVNYEKAGLNTPLNNGDVVSFLTPLAGG
jgi:molybdopterin converting factor small subunit